MRSLELAPNQRGSSRRRTLCEDSAGGRPLKTTVSCIIGCFRGRPQKWARTAICAGFLGAGLPVPHLRRPRRRWFGCGNVVSSCRHPVPTALFHAFTVSNALHGETPSARRGSTDVGVSCYITILEPEQVTSVTHCRRGATGHVEMIGLSPEGFAADGSQRVTKLFTVSFST